VTTALAAIAWIVTLAAPALPGHVVDVVAGDYYITAPDSIYAGITTLRLRTVSGGHGLWLVRLPAGKTLVDFIGDSKEHDLPPWAEYQAGPGFPATGQTANATYILAAGNYLIVCFVRGADGVPHLRKGMIHALAVVMARDIPPALPAAAITVTLTEYKFTFSKPLTAGPHLVRVVNGATVGHEFRLSRVLPGHTVEEAIRWDPASGKPRLDEDYGGLTTLPAGTSLLTTLDLPPGQYLLFCVPQFEHGMFLPLTIARP
jgi:hypothetical protein